MVDTFHHEFVQTYRMWSTSSHICVSAIVCLFKGQEKQREFEHGFNVSSFITKSRVFLNINIFNL